jgi:hypothetical protein
MVDGRSIVIRLIVLCLGISNELSYICMYEVLDILVAKMGRTYRIEYLHTPRIETAGDHLHQRYLDTHFNTQLIKREVVSRVSSQ